MPNLTKIKGWLAEERQLVDSTTNTLSDNLMALSQILGMLSMPLLPALLVTLSLAKALEAEPTAIRYTLTAVTAIGLEALGITASKTAMRLYRSYTDGSTTLPEFLTAAGATALYAALTATAIYQAEHFNGIVATLGTISPIMSVTLYIVVGFNTDLQVKADRRLQLEARKLEIEHETELADLEDYKLRQQQLREQEMLTFKANLEAKTQRKMAKLQAPQAKLSQEERLTMARQLIIDNPSITGTEIGNRLGLTARAGQIIKTKILAEVEENGRHSMDN